MSPMIVSRSPKYLKGVSGRICLGCPPPICSPRVFIARDRPKSYPATSDLPMLMCTPAQAQNSWTHCISLAMCCMFSVKRVASSAKARTLVSTPLGCRTPPPCCSSHRSIALTTKPPKIGDRGHPCRRPLPRGMAADFWPSAWLTLM